MFEWFSNSKNIKFNLSLLLLFFILFSEFPEIQEKRAKEILKPTEIQQIVNKIPFEKRYRTEYLCQTSSSGVLQSVTISSISAPNNIIASGPPSTNYHWSDQSSGTWPIIESSGSSLI